jgi:hypothetical protein
MKILLNEEVRKLKEKDHTRILDILPETSHSGPKKSLNNSSPKRRITVISATTIKDMNLRTFKRSLLILRFNLSFSEIR